MDIDSYKKLLINHTSLSTSLAKSSPSTLSSIPHSSSKSFFNSRFISPFFQPFSFSFFDSSSDIISFAGFACSSTSKSFFSHPSYSSHTSSASFSILLTSYIRSYSKPFINSFYFFTPFINKNNSFSPFSNFFSSPSSFSSFLQSNDFFFKKNLSLFIFQSPSADSSLSLFTYVPCLYNSSKDFHFNFFIKPFNFFTLKKSHFIRSSFLNSSSSFLKPDFSFISSYRFFFTPLPNLLTYSFFYKPLKFLSLPKTSIRPQNELTYLYLKKFSLFFNFPNGFDINIKYYYSKTHSAYTFIENLSRFLIAFIKKNKGGKNKFQQLKNITYKVLQSLILSQVLTSKSHDFLGIGFSYAGRVYGAKKAMSFKMLLGSVPFNTLHANIDYAQITQKTRNGT